MADNDPVVLNDGSTIDREVFDNLEQTLLDEDPDEFRSNRFSTRKSDDAETPFTAKALPTVNNVATKRHNERSERAQSVDEELNAPAAPSYSAWRKNPNRYDIPGVDTIPEDELDRRGREFVSGAQDAGLVDDVERTTMSGAGRRGEFTAEKNTQASGTDRLQRSITAESDLEDEYPVFGEGSVLAHETGHAIDFAGPGDDNERFGSTKFFDGRDDPKYQQALDLTRRVRGEIPEGRENYREDPRELVADSFASAALEPRAAKREAPDLIDGLEDEFSDELSDIGFGQNNSTPFDF